MQIALEDLKNEFPNLPEDYYQTAVERFKENQRVYEHNKKVLHNVYWQKGGVVTGERYRFKGNLYEVTLISEEPRHDEPRVTLAKCLETKVSENYQNEEKVKLSDLKKFYSFESYNKLVRWLNKSK